MAATRVSEVERAYFTRVVGGATPTEPFNNIKRRHMCEELGASVDPHTPFNQLEKAWLRKVIADNGGTPDDGRNIESLWVEAVLAIGEVPSKYLNDNKIKFYINAP